MTSQSYPKEASSLESNGTVMSPPRSTKQESSILRFGSVRTRIATIFATQFAIITIIYITLLSTDNIQLEFGDLNNIASSFLGFAVIGMAYLGLTLAVGLALARTITEPLRTLTRAARDVAQGNRTQIHVDGDDEISDLFMNFNSMVQSIEQRERKIAHIALHDALTGLPNRQYFVEQLDQALHRQRKGTQLVVAYIDLDDFKMVNDTLDHDAGDRLLCDVSAQLQLEFPEGVIARLSGDEFVALIKGIPAHADVASVGMRLQNCFAHNIVLNGRKAEVSASIGIAIAPNDGSSSGTLLKNADLALYRAKQQGKSGHYFFEPALDERAHRRRRLEVDLRAAIDYHQFELHFQPLYSLSDGCLTAFEALIRWNHPVLNMIHPSDFIPLAEETGLITEIGEWVLYEACRQAQTWPLPLPVAVNLSAKQFLIQTLPSMVVQALMATGLPAQRLEVEITEVALYENADKTLKTLHALQQLGVRITLDDFGTGYTSLRHLQVFPFDKLKIDQTFVRDLTSGGTSHAIIGAIVKLADTLGIETLAEGVENTAQLEALRNEGCRQVQGFLLSRPILSGDVREFIQLQQLRPAAERQFA